MATSNTHVARIIEDINYPDLLFEGLVIEARYQINGKNFGRTMTIDTLAPDRAIEYACQKFAREIISARSNMDGTDG